MNKIAKGAIRFALVWIAQAFALLVVTWIVPPVELLGDGAFGVFAVAMSVTLVMALVNMLVRPLVVWLTLPLNIYTLGFSTLLINALVFVFVAWLLPDFKTGDFGAALLASLVFVAVNAIVSALTTLDDNYSFYGGVVQWLSGRKLEQADGSAGRGIVMVEIDGLSSRRLRLAVEKGLMPTVAGMIADGTHSVSTVDCGLPSQTSSCQAGIMYGRNDDIPAFRWYDKDLGKVVASSNLHDAAAMNAHASTGHGLLRQGSSINNHMAGDAAKTLLTMSVLTDTPESMKQRSPHDLYLFFLNPYLFPRTVIMTLWDIVVEVFQSTLQRLRNVRPRVSRYHKGYPLVRAATNVFLRDLSTFMVIMDVIRGVPAVYTTYVGYDEVAHHAGPDTWDALGTLRGLDKQFHRILDVIRRKASRPYELIVLSDHGQSSGATFLQRYGETLTDFIKGLLSENARIVEVNATETGLNHTTALLAELEGLRRSGETGEGGGKKTAVLDRTQKALEKSVEQEKKALGDAGPEGEPAAADYEVQVLASGNLANVYFSMRKGKVSLPELEEAYPGLVDAVAMHPGVGIVLGYAGNGNPLALGKDGSRDLVTGDVAGTDPFIPYGDPDLRAAQFLHVARFEHSGDLVVNSTLYPDGSVAAFEELVGNHGGLGGEQTEAVMVHPADMEFVPTTNSLEVFAQLDARRGLPGEPLQPAPEPDIPSGWDRGSLLAGLRDAGTAARRALGVLALRRAALREIADDPRSNGPALAIVIASALLSGVTDMFDPEVTGPVGLKFVGGLVLSLAVWLVFGSLAHVAGRLVRGKGSLPRTLRVIGYCQIPLLGAPLALVPAVGPYLALAVAVWGILAAWVGLQEALSIGWIRSGLVPVVASIVVGATFFVIASMIDGVALTVQELLVRIGWG